ncbi:MAG: matrixin family metalloprotease [Myxococcota bacterium]
MRPFFVAALLLACTASAFELKRDSTGEVVRWKKNVELVIERQLAARMGDDASLEAIRTAAETLDLGTPSLSLSMREGKTRGVGYDFDVPEANQNDVLLAEHWAFDDDLLAVTVVTVDTRSHSIVDADIAFNPKKKFRVIQKPHGAASEYDVQGTFTHELGHAVGLAHNLDDRESIMYPTATPGDIGKRRLTADDVSGLEVLYPSQGAATETSPEEWEQTVGCSAGATGLAAWLLLTLVPLLRVRRSVLAMVMVSLLVPLGARAEAESPLVGTARVVASTLLPPARGTTLLSTEIELELLTCPEAACTKRMRVTVPGGRFGHLEQWVDGQPVPEVGEVLHVAFRGDREGRILSFERLGSP